MVSGRLRMSSLHCLTHYFHHDFVHVPIGLTSRNWISLANQLAQLAEEHLVQFVLHIIIFYLVKRVVSNPLWFRTFLCYVPYPLPVKALVCIFSLLFLEFEDCLEVGVLLVDALCLVESDVAFDLLRAQNLDHSGLKLLKKLNIHTAYWNDLGCMDSLNSNLKVISIVEYLPGPSIGGRSFDPAAMILLCI
ncbi:hypothetical protein Tco_1319026 [Tanacetum coccineum]